MTQQAKDTLPEPIRNGLGGTILGPRNVPPKLENPDLPASTDTDDGTIANLKFSFANARNRLLTGGWSREVTVREVPPLVRRASSKHRTHSSQSATTGIRNL